jgi:hypothetical protein
MLSSQQSATTGTAGFALQSFYWSKGTSTSNSQNIIVGWQAIGESQLSGYDLESNISGSYVRIAIVSPGITDAAVTHTYTDVISKSSKNYYYRLIYHYVDGSSNVGSPLYVDLKQKSYHICLKPNCWP